MMNWDNMTSWMRTRVYDAIHAVSGLRLITVVN